MPVDLESGQRVRIGRTRGGRTCELFGKVERIEFISNKYGISEWRIVVDVDHMGLRSMEGDGGRWRFCAGRMGKNWPDYFSVAGEAKERVVAD